MGIRISFIVGGVLLAGAAVVGVAALVKRYRNRKRQSSPQQPPAPMPRKSSPPAKDPVAPAPAPIVADIKAYVPPVVRTSVHESQVPLTREELLEQEWEARRKKVIAGEL